LHIDLNDNQLYISSIDPKYFKSLNSMLSFWGFKLSENIFYSNSSNHKETMHKLINYCEKTNIPYTLSKQIETMVNQFSEIDSKFEATRQLCRDFKNGSSKVDKLEEIKTFLNNDIHRTLKGHQIKAACHLYLAQNGANFSVPGAGKTSVVVSVYEKLRKENEVNTLLVIGPPTCFSSWKDEFFETLGRKAKSIILAGGDKFLRKSNYEVLDDNKKFELYITSFQTLIYDVEEITNFLQNPLIKPFIVIDEAHYIKKLNGRWSTAAMALANHSDYKCILTGTPLPRSYSDFYNLFEFLWPNNTPISNHTKTLVEIVDSNDTSSQINDIFENEVGPLHFRVRKSDLSLADQIFHDPIIIEQNPIEKEIYSAINNRIINYEKEDFLKEVDLVNKLRRARIIRLRQAVSYPKLLISAMVNNPEQNSNYRESFSFSDSKIGEMIKTYDRLEIPNKINALMELVESLNKKSNKIIIWSSFVNSIKYISGYLSRHKIKNKYIIGEIPFIDDPLKNVESRNKIKNEFLDPSSGLDVLIANPAAFAESVSLHKTCKHAIYYDLSYNCAQFLQSIDRIHRVGGSETEESHYYFLQYKDSIDSDILTLLYNRRDRMYDLIEKDYSIYSMDMFEEDHEDLNAYERIFTKQ